MTAYNLFNGVYCSQNRDLIAGKLRGDWGFEGVCVTDWGALSDSVASVEAGLDLVMPGPRPDHASEVIEAIRCGELPEARLDEAARRLIALCERYENAATRRRSCPTPSDHLATAQRAAEASAVLLENNGVLPLSPHEDIAVIGSFALRPRYQGAGSSKINPVALDDPWSALCNAGFDARYAQGYDPVTGRRPRSCSRKPARRRAPNIAVVIIGLPDRFESEGFDRSDIVMPAGHEALVSAVCDVNPRTVVVIQGGSPISLPWIARRDGEKRSVADLRPSCSRGWRDAGEAPRSHVFCSERSTPRASSRRRGPQSSKTPRSGTLSPTRAATSCIADHLRRIPLVRRSGNRTRLPLRTRHELRRLPLCEHRRRDH